MGVTSSHFDICGLTRPRNDFPDLPHMTGTLYYNTRATTEVYSASVEPVSNGLVIAAAHLPTLSYV